MPSSNGKPPDLDNDSNSIYSNGSNGITDDHDDVEVEDIEDDITDRLSESQMELLRHALVEHGKRLGELEAKMDKTLADLLAVKIVIDRTHDRMHKIAKRLGVKL